MTPEELRKMALENAKPEYEYILGLLKQAAGQNQTYIKIPRNKISELVLEMLREDGYKIEKGEQYPPRSAFRMPAIKYWKIAF